MIFMERISVYMSLSSLCRHAISFNSIKNNVKILLEIHTENTDDTSKDRPEDAYLIYPKDNHIKIHTLGSKLHLLYSLIKQQFSFCPKYRMSFIFNFPIWHDYLTYKVTKLQPTHKKNALFQF